MLQLYQQQKWAAEFRNGRVLKMVHCLDVLKLSSSVISISCQIVENILFSELCMMKVYAQWIPRLLTIDQKHARLIT